MGKPVPLHARLSIGPGKPEGQQQGPGEACPAAPKPSHWVRSESGPRRRAHPKGKHLPVSPKGLCPQKSHPGLERAGAG